MKRRKKGKRKKKLNKIRRKLEGNQIESNQNETVY
jgi:hypothetical protein